MSLPDPPGGPGLGWRKVPAKKYWLEPQVGVGGNAGRVQLADGPNEYPAQKQAKKSIGGGDPRPSITAFFGTLDTFFNRFFFWLFAPKMVSVQTGPLYFEDFRTPLPGGV